MDAGSQADQVGGEPVEHRTQILSVSIGRSESMAVRIDASSVSGRHAILAVHDGRLQLSDVGSSNGTYVNGQRITTAYVTPSDRVLIGTAPMPWNHPAVAPLLDAVGHDPASAPMPRGQTPRSHATDDLDRLPRQSWLPTVGVLVLLAAVGGLGVVGLGIWLAVDRGPLAASVQDPPGSTEVSSGVSEGSVGTGPLFAVDSPPMSAGLFPERMADQVDLRRQEERVRDVRFRLRSGVVDSAMLGNTNRVRPRESWAVPLGVVDRDGRSHYAVATTRCLIDYQYPQQRDRSGYRNLAIFSGAGRSEEVFRVVSPQLAGFEVYDQNGSWNPFAHGRAHLSGAAGDRYFGVLQRDLSLGAVAELPIGDWSNSSGVDIAVLFFPMDDPGVRAMRPSQNLRMRDPIARLRDALQDRTSLWGDTFEFSLVSRECMDWAQEEVAEMDQTIRHWRMFAVATAMVLVGVISGGIASGAFPALSSMVSNALARRVVSAMAGAIWRTVVRHLSGENLHDVAWDEAGRLVVSFARDRGVEETIVGGLTSTGLSQPDASRVLETVRSLVERRGEFTVPTMRRDGEEYGALIQADGRLDVAAELIRRGLVRLDTSNDGLLRQQPTLLRAARDALLDASAAERPAIVDPAYRARILSLSEALSVQ